MREVNLEKYDNSHYDPGPVLKRALWYVVNRVFFQNYLFPLSGLKRALLRAFGARIGNGVVIKPAVNIKYPWFLRVGNHTWIGEGVWIDNLTQVTIGSHVCLSQGCMLLTGNHNYKKTTFDLETGKITLENGVWIGARAVVGPGVKCHSHSVLSICSVATRDLEAYHIYAGNPCRAIRQRIIE